MNETIGQLITEPQERDAIHIAIVPMVVGEDYLRPGEHVGIKSGTVDTIIRRDPVYREQGAIGVIDPFLMLPIQRYTLVQGDRVWVFLYPGTITGLRHEWTHPAFEKAARISADATESELWLRQFADRWHFDYDEMIELAKNANQESEWGAYVVAKGVDLHSKNELGEDHDLFWTHLELLTGRIFNDAHREKLGWSCSC